MNTDILIIGSGGAGLSAALSAKEQGANVIVACKSLPTNAQTCMAQGGINASFDDKEIDTHISDTLRSSHGLGNEQMVRTMCENSGNAIEWLLSLGVPFSLNEKDNLAKRFMGGASQKRTCYAQDYTGLKILHTLYDNCLKNGVIFKSERLLLNLIVEDKTVQGATFLDITTGEVEAIYAKSVVISTGGYSAVYHGFSTNGTGSTGDGIASVIRAGGVASDLEFVQFHPTALKKSSILVSEAARGEGGYLVNSEGVRFINELAPRDEVARAITSEINNGKDVFLDLRHLGREKLTELLPQEMKLCSLHEDVDMANELIPIKPAAHYTMGGIEIKHSLEARDIKGCFAVGECSNAHVHGANRLGGNSLLEIIALGRIAGINASKFEPKTNAKNREQLFKDKHFIAGVYNFTNQINFYERENF